MGHVPLWQRKRGCGDMTLIEIAIDIFLIAAVFYLAILNSKRSRADEKRKIDFEELERHVKALDSAVENIAAEVEKGHKSKGPSEDKKRWTLLNTLNKQTRAANSAIEKLSAEKEKGIKCSEELAKGLDSRKAELEGYLERIDSLLKTLEETVPDAEVIPDESDKYREASRLAEEGHSLDEIVERVGLPKGEVQLIVGLKKQ